MYGLVFRCLTLLLAGLSLIASPLETKAQGSPEASASSQQEVKAEESTSAESKQSDSGLEKKDPTKSQSAEVSQGGQPQGLANATNPIRALSAGAAAPSMGVMLAVGAGAVAAIAGGGGGGGSGTSRTVVSTSYSYAGAVETTTVTYSDGSVATSSANATSNTVSWASDNVTRTTTYTFAGGRTNAVVDTVPGTDSTPALTAAVYPSGWTTGAAVTPPSVSARRTTYGNGVVVTREDGTSATPFTQSTLSSSSITDSNSFVTSSTTTYDLRWGTPDRDGPGYANLFPNATNPLANPLFYMGRRVSSFTSLAAGPTLNQPAADVLAAWNAGWTGKGVNVLMVDGYRNVASCADDENCHGIITMMINNLVARGATQFALDFDVSAGTITGVARDSANVPLTSSRSINVTNASFGTNWIGNGYTSSYGQIPTASQITNYLSAAQPHITAWTNFFSGVTSVSNLTNLANAVIVKSAGNDGIDANYDQYVKSYASDSSISPRLLVVGALNRDGTTGSKATIEPYSNTAGATASVANRFVVANGNTPYGNSSVGINGFRATDPGSGFRGTSYAAPRVAGYAAIVMQKFPNLDAARTSNIILDTARYDTLTCHPNCDPAIYGKGEASLSRALAPIGRLR